MRAHITSVHGVSTKTTKSPPHRHRLAQDCPCSACGFSLVKLSLEKPNKSYGGLLGVVGTKSKEGPTDPAVLLPLLMAVQCHTGDLLPHSSKQRGEGRSHLLPGALQDSDWGALVVSEDADGHSCARAADSHEPVLAPR